MKKVRRESTVYHLPNDNTANIAPTVPPERFVTGYTRYKYKQQHEVRGEKNVDP